MLRTHLATWIQRYLNQEASREELGEWLLSHLQDILDSGDESAITLANHIDADLVELSEGLIDEAILQDRFIRYLTDASISSEYRTHTNSEADIVFTGVPGAERTFHFRHAEVA